MNVSHFTSSRSVSAREAMAFTDGLAKDGFLADRRTQQAVVMSLMIIGEAAAQVLTRYPDVVSRNPEVPWVSMRGMRNRIAHGYFSVDMEIVWETVDHILPDLLSALDTLA